MVTGDEQLAAAEAEEASLAALVHTLLGERGATVAVAESLTGGALGASLTRAPGSSATFRGGVVAYATPLKASLLGVDAGLLASRGAVNPEVAAQMAEGVRVRLSAGYGVAITGVAGPEPQDGAPVGTVYVAVAGPDGCTVRSWHFAGDRDVVRRRSVEAALDLLRAALLGRGSMAGKESL